MKRWQREFPIAVMSRVLGVSRSGCYGSRNRAPSPRACEDARLKLAIKAAHIQARETYGCRRLQPELMAQAFAAGLLEAVPGSNRQRMNFLGRVYAPGLQPSRYRRRPGNWAALPRSTVRKQFRVHRSLLRMTETGVGYRYLGYFDLPGSRLGSGWLEGAARTARLRASADEEFF